MSLQSIGDIKMPQPLVICRICLSSDERFFTISGTPLQLVFETVTNNRLHIDKWPTSACYICYSQLKRCHRLILASNSAAKILVEMLEKYPEVTMEAVAKLHRPQLYSLAVTPTENYDITAPWGNVAVKTEPKCEVVEETESKESQGLQQHPDAMVVIPTTPNSEHDTASQHHFLGSRQSPTDRETCAVQSADASHECHLCRRRYSRRDHLLRHLRTAHSGEKPHECEVCHRRFSRKDHYLVHLKTHNGHSQPSSLGTSDVSDRKLNDDSSITLPEARSLVMNFKVEEYTGEGLQQPPDSMVVIPDNYQHDTTHHMGAAWETDVGRETSVEQSGDASHQCPVCRRQYYRRYHLLRHLRTTHSGEKPHECDVCKRRFTRKDHYETHLKTHTGEKPFQCDVCQLKFSKNYLLTSHYRTHTGEKPFECDICQLRFSQKRLMLYHLKTHIGKEPFQCQVCLSRFNQKNSLDTHMLAHAAEKPFVCDICQRGFYQKGNLLLHIKTHTGEEPFDCSVCQRNFITKSDLLSHSMIHTDEKPYECSDCQTRFKRVGDMKRHMLIHTRENRHKFEKSFIVSDTVM